MQQMQQMQDLCDVTMESSALLFSKLEAQNIPIEILSGKH